MAERLEFEYDTAGARGEKSVFTAATGITVTNRFAFDGTNIWMDLDGVNAPVTRRIFGDANEVLARITISSGEAAWYLLDRQGSVRQMTDALGAVQYTVTYGGFGNIETEFNVGFGDAYKYTGQKLDIETGFQIHWWRYYDPPSGRWMGEDPGETHYSPRKISY